ncbi:MAG: APC family permease [Chloroflexi bacterium]|nr:APC family permease [Chloroflexota bacterium]MBM3154008.1 APC family permease [Chloroflexota bacterium]MBM3174910.1 APC family permease [Chloroflexota bacterium]MBM4449689.1 APC family permease [Chloroflexota bacterium]
MIEIVSSHVRRCVLASLANQQEVKLGRVIGLWGGVALVVGGIIGMGIYALIAGIAAQAGSALWLAFILGILISAIGVLPIIQVAAAIPRAGAGYLYASRLLNPFWGMLASYWAVLGGACSTVFVCIGLSCYIAAYWSWGIDGNLQIIILSLIIPAVFFLLYLFKLRLANWLQIILVAQLVIALVVYGIAGSFQADRPLQFSLSPSQGFAGLVMATILAYSTCMGFQVIAEMGEEIKNPKRNITLSLIIGGSVVLILYILVGTVFVSSIPYDFDAIKAMRAPLMDTASLFLPIGVVGFISIGALTAALTSLNAGFIALPRELLSQARDELLPASVGKISSRTLTPLRAVGIYCLLVIGLLLLQFAGFDIDFFAVMAATGILLMTVLVAVAATRLPDRYPEQYSKAYFKISKPWLVFITILAVITSLSFVILVLLDYKSTATVAGIFCALTIVAVIYYFIRVNYLKKRGVNWSEITHRITGSEE